MIQSFLDSVQLIGSAQSTAEGASAKPLGDLQANQKHTHESFLAYIRKVAGERIESTELSVASQDNQQLLSEVTLAPNGDSDIPLNPEAVALQVGQLPVQTRAGQNEKAISLGNNEEASLESEIDLGNGLPSDVGRIAYPIHPVPEAKGSQIQVQSAGAAVDESGFEIPLAEGERTPTLRQSSFDSIGTSQQQTSSPNIHRSVDGEPKQLTVSEGIRESAKVASEVAEPAKLQPKSTQPTPAALEENLAKEAPGRSLSRHELGPKFPSSATEPTLETELASELPEEVGRSKTVVKENVPLSNKDLPATPSSLYTASSNPTSVSSVGNNSASSTNVAFDPAQIPTAESPAAIESNASNLDETLVRNVEADSHLSTEDSAGHESDAVTNSDQDSVLTLSQHSSATSQLSSADEVARVVYSTQVPGPAVGRRAISSQFDNPEIATDEVIEEASEGEILDIDAESADAAELRPATQIDARTAASQLSLQSGEVFTTDAGPASQTNSIPNSEVSFAPVGNTQAEIVAPPTENAAAVRTEQFTLGQAEDGLRVQVFEAIKESVDEVGVPKPGTLNVQLNPKELGSIQIQVEHLDDVIRATIVAEQAMTSELMLANQDALIDSLAELGITEANIEIRSDSDSGAEFSERLQTDLESEEQGDATNNLDRRSEERSRDGRETERETQADTSSPNTTDQPKAINIVA